MKEMQLSNKAQELLERYWIEHKENQSQWQVPVSSDPVCEEIIQGGYAINHEGNLELTQKGWQEACSCVRRHRLAERLLTDIIDIKQELAREIGCEFEHLLSKDVEENICILLGHPSRCPHNKFIPQGECCKFKKLHPQRVAMPLSEFQEGQKGKIAYVATRDAAMMNKLSALGVLPGLTVVLLKKKPAYLFQIGESQFAIDRELAESIHVRLVQNNQQEK